MGSEWALKAASPSLHTPASPFTACVVWVMLLNLAQIYVVLFQQELPIPALRAVVYIRDYMQYLPNI